jgi:hypothetical protein
LLLYCSNQVSELENDLSQRRRFDLDQNGTAPAVLLGLPTVHQPRRLPIETANSHQPTDPAHPGRGSEVDATRLVGFELEMSDIKTVDAATIVYGNLDHWKDRHGHHVKPTLTYDRFHVVSDATLRNSDRTGCMISYIDSEGRRQPADSSEGHPDHLRWKGAELISPAFDWESDARRMVLGRCEYDFFPRFKEAGAVCKPHLCDGLHVHIDISALSWKEVRDLLLAIESVQWELGRLTSEWYGHRFFSPKELESLRAADTPEAFDASYRTIQYGTGRYLLPRYDDRIRRVVDIGPYLDPNRPNTIEFRCFRAAMDTSYIDDCIRLALAVVDGHDHADFVKDITIHVWELLWAYREEVFTGDSAGEVWQGGGPPYGVDESWRIAG